MDEIELIRELKNQANGLPLRDEGKLDALNRRAEMIIRNVFGDTSKYLSDFQSHLFLSDGLSDHLAKRTGSLERRASTGTQPD